MKIALAKTFGLFLLGGAALGNAMATFIAPGMLTWYNTPGAGSAQAICDTAKMSHEIFSQLIQAQLIGSGIGAALGLGLGLWFTFRRNRAAASPPPAAGVPT